MNDNEENVNPLIWIQKKRIEDRLSDRPQPAPRPDEPNKSAVPLNTKPMVTQSGWNEAFETFFHRAVLELLEKPEDLLKLNPSRRDSIARFLSEISQQPEPEDTQNILRQFIRPERTAKEHEAIKQLFKQIAWVHIGRALLLKSWNVHDQHHLTPSDLRDLTSSVERVIRPLIQLKTSTYQLIQQNFFSWSKLSVPLQQELWTLLEAIPLQDWTDSKVLDWLLDRAIRLSAETLGERQRYREPFYQNLWKQLNRSSLLDPRFHQQLKQGLSPYAFCPTLRDGSIMKYANPNLNWIGFESLSFELIFCEIRSLWKGPKSPPFWTKGSGLEMCMDTQTNFLVSHDGKQNTLQQIENINSCEFAFIAEESLIRVQARTQAARVLRKQVDSHAILKRLKHPHSSRGMYQACQAINKLRQNGVLVWAREELLSENCGKPVLQYLLAEARLMMIADFSTLQTETEALRLELPKTLYFFKKENDIEKRKNHRPLWVKAYGTLRHEREIQTLFERVFTFFEKPDAIFPAEPFALHSRVSPVPQSEWEHHWFNPSDDQLVERIEDLKRNSSPLGQISMIRTIPLLTLGTDNDPNSNEWNALFTGVDTKTVDGFYVWSEPTKTGCEICTAPSTRPPKHLKPGSSLFWVAPHQSGWAACIQMVLRSGMIQDWLNYSVERKKGCWQLRESDLKAIPVPNHLYQYLQTANHSHYFEPDEEVMLNQIAFEPGIVHQKMERFFSQKPSLRSACFIRAAEVLVEIEFNSAALHTLVLSEDQLDWPKLVDLLLPESERAPLNHHPLVRFQQSLPLQVTVQSVTSVKHPSPGVLLANAKGLTQMFHIQHSWLRDLVTDRINQIIRSLNEPTLAEIFQHALLPKNPDQCLAIGQQLVQTFAQEKMRRKELSHLMGACLIGQNISQPNLGLLQ